MFERAHINEPDKMGISIRLRFTPLNECIFIYPKEITTYE